MFFGFYHSTIIPRTMEIIRSSTWSFPHFPVLSSLLRVNIKLNTLVSRLKIYEEPVSLSNTVQSGRYLSTFRINLLDSPSDSENKNTSKDGGRKFLRRVCIYLTYSTSNIHIHRHNNQISLSLPLMSSSHLSVVNYRHNGICTVRIQASRSVWRFPSFWTKCHVQCDNKNTTVVTAVNKWILYTLINQNFKILFILLWQWKETFFFFSRSRKPGYFSFFLTRICLRSAGEVIPRALTVPRDKRYGLHEQYLLDAWKPSWDSHIYT